MAYNKLYANSFKYGLLFGKDIEPGKPVGVSVLDEADVVLAIKKAYVDMMPRTFKNKSVDDNQGLDSKMKEALFLSLAEKIVKYMQEGAHDFNIWHNEICTFFMEEFKKILKKANKNADNSTYGKAQKIVNMTFKYLYCYDDTEKHIDKFFPCHMALDSYILAWFFDWYSAKYNQDKKRGEKITKNGKNQLPKWSNLKYQKDNSSDVIPQYIEIQEAIRTHIANEMPNIPPIEAEFMIWYKERKKRRRE